MISRDKKNPQDSSKYRPDIDGLRALAIVPVVLFHADLGFSGGFVGVDVFFVISGFLITALISREIEAGSFDLITFWERRIRRILPALLVVVLTTLVAGWYLFLPEDFSFIGKSVVAQSLLMSNVLFWRNTGYFDAGVDTLPLLHTWSLAVEEQFYVLFPLLLVAIVRYKFTSIARAVLLLGVGSFVPSIIGSHSDPSATFYLLPTRAWELLVGAFLAVTPASRISRPWVNEGLGLTGLGLILYAVFTYTHETRFPGLAAVPPCLGAAAIIFTGHPQPTLVSRLLSTGPLVSIGLISYSWYLWHWPLLVFSKYLAQGAPGPGLRVGLVGAGIVLAILSWRFVETPFRKRLIFPRRTQILMFGGSTLATLVVLGLVVHRSHGFPARFPATALTYAAARNHQAFRNEATLDQAMAGQFFELGAKDVSQPVTVLVWGDSHAMAVTSVLDELCRKFSQRGIQATHSHNIPLLNYVGTLPFSFKENAPAYNQAILDYIAKHHVKAVVMAAAWNGYPASDSLKASLLSTVRAVTDTGAQVYILKEVPVPGFDVPRVTAIAAMHGRPLEELGTTRVMYQERNDEINRVFAQAARLGAVVLDPSGYLLNDRGIYGVIQHGQILYWDSHHLTVEGARVLAPLFEPIFLSHAKRHSD